MNDKQRTKQQNDALHLYFKQVSDELLDKGITMNDVVKLYKAIELTPTPEMVKNAIWRPIQLALLKKESTTALTSEEITNVYENVSRFLAQLEISLPFPSIDELLNKELDGLR